MNAHTEQPPVAVIEHFAQVTDGLTWHRAAPGFSGATVWRGDDATGAPLVALKGWPLSTPLERIQQIHLWLSRAASLPFVPTVFAGVRKQTAVLVDGHLWDACRWMLGTPRAAPTETEVRTACIAVARLHRCWPVLADWRPCRGVTARINILSDHRALLEEWNRRLPSVTPELDPLLRRAVCEVARLADSAIAALRPWAAWPLPLQPCVRDLRGEHVLFEGDRVSGIIDFGAMAFDHPAVDLARLLDDYTATDPSLFGAGLDAYRAAAAPLEVPDEFIHVLSRTGVVCSVLGWLIRIFVRREVVARPAATAFRLSELLVRVERITHF